MGECNYYLKARFRNPKEATIALPLLAALLAEGERAYAFWQGSRPWSGPGPTAGEFWAGFCSRFPLVRDYLGGLADSEDWNNGLAGHLSLVDPGAEHGRATLVRDGDCLKLTLHDIWHFSDLSLLEKYVRERLAAEGVGSISEEDIEMVREEYDPDVGDDPFELIEV